MATGVKDDPRTGTSLPPSPPVPPDARIRVPRLLVVGSELSWRLLACLAAAAAVIYLIAKVSFAFVPVILALLLATLLVPPARWLQRRGAPPALATVAVFFTSLVLLAAIVTLLAPSVAGEFGTLGDRIKSGADKAGGYLADSPLDLDEAQVQREIDRIDDRLRDNSSAVTSGVLSGAAVVGQLLAGLAITLVVLFFFVKDGPRLWQWALRLAPQGQRVAVAQAGEESWRVLTQYVRGVVLVAVVDAVGIGLALWIIGVPLVIPLAILTFFAAFIPVLGSIAAGAAAALVALVHGGPVDALLVVGATILVQQLEGNVLYPTIIGRQVALHPIAILLAVTVGAITAGIVGAAIAVPVMVMATVAVRVIAEHSQGGEVIVDATAPPDG